MVYGNRTSYSKFISRWNAPYGKDEQRSTGKNGGDTQAGSRTVGDEGYKTNETSEEGTRNTIDFFVGIGYNRWRHSDGKLQEG